MPSKTAKFKRFALKLVAPALLLFMTATSLADNWRLLSPGIEYRDLSATVLYPWSHIHVFKVSLSNNIFQSVSAKSLSRPFASADEFSKRTDALIAINGGFFDHKSQPLGLRISDFKQENPLKKISWWGVFYIENNLPHIASPKRFSPSENIEFAIQSGPRLLVKGKVTHLKPGVAERTALGITKDNQIIILVTENKPLSTIDLAELMKSPPLNCEYALNLDGGSSSQIRANLGTFQINAHGYAEVSDAVVVKKRSS